MLRKQNLSSCCRYQTVFKSAPLWNNSFLMNRFFTEEKLSIPKQSWRLDGTFRIFRSFRTSKVFLNYYCLDILCLMYKILVHSLSLRAKFSRNHKARSCAPRLTARRDTVLNVPLANPVPSSLTLRFYFPAMNHFPVSIVRSFPWQKHREANSEARRN